MPGGAKKAVFPTMAMNDPQHRREAAAEHRKGLTRGKSTDGGKESPEKEKDPHSKHKSGKTPPMTKSNSSSGHSSSEHHGGHHHHHNHAQAQAQQHHSHGHHHAQAQQGQHGHHHHHHSHHHHDGKQEAGHAPSTAGALPAAPSTAK